MGESPQASPAGVARRCAECRRLKAVDEFSRDRRVRDGLNRRCRSCLQAHSRSKKPSGHQPDPHQRHRKILSPDISEKVCANCKVLKPIDAFARDPRYPDNRAKRCRKCLGIERAPRQFSRGPRNPGGSLETRVAWERRYYTEHREQYRANGRAWNDRLRREVLDAYGHQCACCSETTAEFLAVDHIDGRGGEHRRELNHLRPRVLPLAKAPGIPARQLQAALPQLQ